MRREYLTPGYGSDLMRNHKMENPTTNRSEEKKESGDEARDDSQTKNDAEAGNAIATTNPLM